jgi:hypothetical protein
MASGFGTWFTYKDPVWVENIDYSPESLIRQTGMSREELKKLLFFLEDNDFFKDFHEDQNYR